MLGGRYVWRLGGVGGKERVGVCSGYDPDTLYICMIFFKE